MIARDFTRVTRIEFHSGGERYGSAASAGWTLASSMRKNPLAVETDVG
jgi:hypothetical protein